MTKEEILAQSRKNNQKMDERENQALALSGRLAAQVGMIVCCLVAVIQVIFTQNISYESWMIYFSILGSMFLGKYIKLKERHELLLTILFCAFFVFFTVLFVIRLLG